MLSSATKMLRYADKESSLAQKVGEDLKQLREELARFVAKPTSDTRLLYDKAAQLRHSMEALQLEKFAIVGKISEREELKSREWYRTHEAVLNTYREDLGMDTINQLLGDLYNG